LSQLARERGAIRFVMGLPLHMDGRQGPEAAAARSFAAALEEATSLPVEWIDERWTTLEARRIQQEMGATRSRRAEPVDDAAAAIILRTWLERERSREPGESH
jgi:putative Holliday junction resolvase